MISNRPLAIKNKIIRQDTLKRKKPLDIDQLKQPVSFWIKEDRLLNEIGKEFTIILRTKGCSWALGENGGCTMCGYINDANIEPVSPSLIKSQFDFAFDNKIDKIKNDKEKYILKIFNSGSFFDDNEIPKSIREYIFERTLDIKNINEIVVESRIEFLNSEKLIEMRNELGNKYVEIAIGIETVDDYIRNHYINKGFLLDDFKKVLNRCKEHNLGVKAYLLFKPPFINEQIAIEDCSNSIRSLIKLGVNSISINPLNIQKGTFVEYLWYQKRYRPPWFYSLFKCLRNSINQHDLKKVRILSDPSGAGTKRGIHNCLKRECENSARTILKNFVLNQDIRKLDEQIYTCECKKIYQLKKWFN